MAEQQRGGAHLGRQRKSNQEGRGALARRLGRRADAPREIRSQIQAALLALMFERPGYGYELALRYRTTFAALAGDCAESYIYSALEQLRRRGLVEAVPPAELPPAARGHAEGGRPRTYFRLSASGRETFQEHVYALLLDWSRQRALVLRQLAALAPEPQAALEVVDLFERRLLAHVKEPEVIPATTPAGQLAAELLAQARSLGGECMLALVEATRRRFEELARAQPSAGATAAGGQGQP